MVDVKTEIARVQNALSKTTSPHLKHDYNKYLKKLYRQLKVSDVNGR